MPQHPDRTYETELSTLRERILYMGAKVEEIVAASVEAFQTRDPELARSTLSLDHDINRLEVEIDGFTLSILARRQPVASDLRFLTTTLKLVTDLERIGDIAVNICERVVGFAADPPRHEYPGISRMAKTVQGMLRDALDAFVATDAAKARDVVERDQTVDTLYVQVFQDVLHVLMDDRSAVHRGMGLQSVAKYLERIGDHATNVAEQVVYLLKGTDIRHSGPPTD